MSDIMKDIDNILGKMHTQVVATDKGTYGEQAAFRICEDVYNKHSGILIHSYTYKTVEGLPGNIKKAGNSYYKENLGSTTEIDILLATPYKIFVLEVKAYKAQTITLYNDRITGCYSKDKSPEHQNEMHLRHLYPQIFKCIPDGSTKYIVPIVVFVDECKVLDKRTGFHKDYIYVTVLDRLHDLINNHNVPVNKTIINLKDLEMNLRRCMIKSDKFLPYMPK